MVVHVSLEHGIILWRCYWKRRRTDLYQHRCKRFVMLIFKKWYMVQTCYVNQSAMLDFCAYYSQSLNARHYLIMITFVSIKAYIFCCDINVFLFSAFLDFFLNQTMHALVCNWDTSDFRSLNGTSWSSHIILIFYKHV